jgi:hypothetical protein
MSQSIQFDSTELRNTTYIPRFVKHESATERDLNILNLARDDGGVLVNDRRGVKRITLQGILTATSESGLETAIDTFKELFSRVAKNLDISWAGSTRRYVATCQFHNFDRDFFHLLFVPWTAEFVVVNGVGSDTTLTACKHAVSVNSSPFVISPAPVFAGSAKPKPLVTFEIGAGHTKPCGIMLENQDNGQKLIYNKQTALAENDTIIMDYANKKVTLEGVEQPFYGVFPDLIIGTNNLRITVADIVDQQFIMTDLGAGATFIYGDNFYAESFVVPYTDATYRKLSAWLARIGTPADDITLRIETDAGGKPSGTLVDANAEKVITYLAVGTWPDPIYAVFELPANISLNAGTLYWIVLKSASSVNTSNCYRLPLETSADASYSKGKVSYSVDAGANWVEYAPVANFGFKLMYGGTVDGSMGTVTLDIDYYKLWL